MARIKWFETQGIAIYIYAELFGKHHNPHVFVRRTTVESTQYGFDGNPIKGCKKLKRPQDHKLVSCWILSKKEKLEEAWNMINKGIDPGMLD